MYTESLSSKNIIDYEECNTMISDMLDRLKIGRKPNSYIASALQRIKINTSVKREYVTLLKCSKVYWFR